MKIVKKLWFKITISIMMIVILISAVFFVYVNNYYKADEVAISVLKGNDVVSVSEYDNYYLFTNNSHNSKVGYIFYPGGKVEAKSYDPLMNLLAVKGITCVLLKEPFNLAVFAPDLANEPISTVNGITNWYVGGHSLGGVMASSYAASYSDKINGLILMGAYPYKNLASTNLRMLSFYGSNDGVLNLEEFEKNKVNAPKDSTYFEIQGGNHSYYGNYGEQDGDFKSDITQFEQQEIVASEILNWIQISLTSVVSQ